MKKQEFGVIDAVCNLLTPERVARRGEGQILYTHTFKGSAAGREGVTVEQLLERMDALGIERAFLIAEKAGSKYHGAFWNPTYEEIAEVTAAYPDRFSALAGIDPLEGMEGVRQLESAVRDMGFIGAHLYPHWFEMEPDHRKYYPFYAKCVELNVPIQMQVGQCLIYRNDIPPLRSVGRPIFLDTVACDLPELKIIGIHTGYPWVEEMISVAAKHPNVYIGSDAYAPRYWKPEFVHFINSWGQDKVIFGTDFPVIDQERALREIDGLNLKPEARKKLLRENAVRVYNLEK